MSIIVTGSIAWDYLMRFPGYFKDHILPEHVSNLSVSFLVDDKERHRGGCGPNIAYNLALLGNRPKLMATAGMDFGDYQRWLEEQGIDTSLTMVYSDEFTATFTVITDREQNQIASFHSGAMTRARELSFFDLDINDIEWVIISPNDPDAMVSYAEQCQQLGIPYVYDPSQQLARLSAEDLMRSMKGANVLTVNDYELEMTKKLTGLDENGLLEHVEALVVTRGADGASAYTRTGSYHVPAAKAQAIVEPTGVGDAFRAGLLTGLNRQFDWPSTLRLGNVAAVYVIEHAGTQNHRYSAAEFMRRYQENYGEEPRLQELFTKNQEPSQE